MFNKIVFSNYYLRKRRDLKKDGKASTNTPFQDIQARAFSILERQKLMMVADQIASDVKIDEIAFQREHIDKLARQFKRHLRPILLMVDFGSSLTNDPLVEAVDFMKLSFIKNQIAGGHPNLKDGVCKGRPPLSWNCLVFYDKTSLT